MGLFDSHWRMLRRVQPLGVTGCVSGAHGLTVRASQVPAPLGAACRIGAADGGVDARVIGFDGETTLLMGLGDLAGVRRGDPVRFVSAEETVGVGPAMLGRVLDGLGRPIDGRGALAIEDRVPIRPEPIAPMGRRRITEPLPTGVRAIDAMLTVGRGQRMGIFSASGVGKSVLLGMIGRYTAAEVAVIALIGERGREVRDFIEKDLGPNGLKRSVVVASTGDEPPLARVQAGATATAVAEYFRDRGRDVLLLMDSVTRLAAAQRQVGLAAGEPPATRGYPPSVFDLLPELLERTGRTERGSITGFYTALVEGGDPAEPVAEAVRSITDGHIWLSRAIANRGHYPAVDCLQSISRIMIDVVDDTWRRQAMHVRKLISLYSQVEELVNLGAYRRGANVEYDRAIDAMPRIREFLAQPIERGADFADTRRALAHLCRRVGLAVEEAAEPPRSPQPV